MPFGRLIEKIGKDAIHNAIILHEIIWNNDLTTISFHQANYRRYRMQFFHAFIRAHRFSNYYYR